MRLKPLSLKDKPLFDKYLGLSRHELSVYAFENIYIWKKLFRIEWAVLEENLCVFFTDKFARFLYLAPVGGELTPGAVEGLFRQMDKCSRNPQFSRIDNVEEGQADFFRKLGLSVKEQSRDYVCRRSDLSELKGNGFKHKRASCNYFLRNYEFRYLDYSARHLKECLCLYELWAGMRGEEKNDPVYQGMMADSRISLETLLKDYKKLNCAGKVLEVGGKIKGFTFGYPLNADTFCVLFEITDLSVKGAAQFIFRSFCRELEGFKYVNIMDDSGLKNLREVKLSYRPAGFVPAYSVRR